jgi:hypothetical protein
VGGLVHLHEPEERFDGPLSVANQAAAFERISRPALVSPPSPRRSSARTSSRTWARKGSYGYNAATGEYGDTLEAGILDPTKVTRLALQNAASVAVAVAWATWACKRSAYTFSVRSSGPGGKLPGFFR